MLCSSTDEANRRRSTEHHWISAKPCFGLRAYGRMFRREHKRFWKFAANWLMFFQCCASQMHDADRAAAGLGLNDAESIVLYVERLHSI
jgi:hypothetical protein